MFIEKCLFVVVVFGKWMEIWTKKKNFEYCRILFVLMWYGMLCMCEIQHVPICIDLDLICLHQPDPLSSSIINTPSQSNWLIKANFQLRNHGILKMHRLFVTTRLENQFFCEEICYYLSYFFILIKFFWKSSQFCGKGKKSILSYNSSCFCTNWTENV